MKLLITSRSGTRSRTGALATELMIAISVLAIGIIPLAYSYTQETRMARSLYYHSIAMEIVDGEMEILRAGEWRTFPRGNTTPYPVRAKAVKNLPQGKFQLTILEKRLRLEWSAEKKDQGGSVFREIDLP